ncbi:MAG: amidohydrolase family protein [Planctomycetota bacterium]
MVGLSIAFALIALSGPGERAAGLGERAAGLGGASDGVAARAASKGAAATKVEPGLALLAAKVLVCSLEGPMAVDNAVVLVRDGVIVALGDRDEVQIPAGYDVRDLGDLWLSPGMIDLHSHVAMGLNDLSETVFLTNPGMRASVGVVPGYVHMQDAVAGGVTTVLHIPGSATNMGGAGVILRTGGATYEDMLVRDPGSLKLAQAGNPERRGPWFPQRSLMNWNTRDTFRRGVAYAKRWLAHELGGAPKPERDLQFDVFISLLKREAQVSTHTQMAQVVGMTLSLVAEEFKLPVFIDHGTFDGYRVAGRAAELGIIAILGPRQISVPYNRPGFTIDQDGALYGVAERYQAAGHRMVGFNTDAVGPPSSNGPGQEELSLQAAMGVRYGFNNDDGAAVRGVTIVPAIAAGIDKRVGSIEPGKDADLIATKGDPNDPRASVELVLMRGRVIYDTAVDRRRF